MYGNGYKMNGTVITMVHPMMAVVGVRVLVPKTLAILIITLAIRPPVFCGVVTGTTSRHGYEPLRVPTAARQTGTSAAVVVLPDRSPEPTEPLNYSLSFGL